MIVLPSRLYSRDPLDILIENERRTCKGCAHLIVERVFGEDHKFCTKRRQAGQRCSMYKETD